MPPVNDPTAQVVPAAPLSATVEDAAQVPVTVAPAAAIAATVAAAPNLTATVTTPPAVSAPLVAVVHPTAAVQAAPAIAAQLAALPDTFVRSYEPNMQLLRRILVAEMAKTNPGSPEWMSPANDTTEVKIPPMWLPYPELQEQTHIEYRATGFYTQSTGGPQTIHIYLYANGTQFADFQYTGVAAFTGTARVLLEVHLDAIGVFCGTHEQFVTCELTIYEPVSGAVVISGKQRRVLNIDAYSDQLVQPRFKKDVSLAGNSLNIASVVAAQDAVKSSGAP